MQKIVFYALMLKLSVSPFMLQAEDFKTVKDIVDIVKQHTPERTAFAESIASSLYEKKEQRRILDAEGNNTYGREYPLNPEMLVELMGMAKGKRILEIAGAWGQNSLLLGLAGAEHVYLNDITSSQIDFFNHTVSQLNIEGLESRFTGIKGNCFTLDQHIPEHSLDIILVRNYFHLLTTNQYATFFHLIKKLLKPGGVLAMTVNGKYGNMSQIKDDFMHFKIVTLMAPQDKSLLRWVEEFDDEKQSIVRKNILLARFPKNGKALICNELIDALPQYFSETLKEYIKTATEIEGDFRLLTQISTLFSPKNLTHLLMKNGFNVNKAKRMGLHGHYQSEEEQSAGLGYATVGVIAQVAS